ncbi:MAG: hypothetical protein AAGI91_04385 [Bacteroidota bacterium]
MSHPDQHAPDDHRSPTHQSAPKAGASAELAGEIKDEDLKQDADTGAVVRAETPEEEARQGEAGNAYVGRGMRDDLKATPRIEDADQVQDGD